jgi:K+-sensing histidine kinase KdpD
MDILTVAIAGLIGVITNLLYDVIKSYYIRKSDPRKVSVKMPSGQSFEIDAPLDDDKLFNKKLTSLIYTTEPISISKKKNVNLLKDVVLPSASIFEKSLKKKDLKLAIGNLDKISNINADAQALQNVFFNLIDNAVKYSSPGRTIKIDGQETEDSVDVTITGSSSAYLKPTEIERIFEKGFRGEKATTENQTGLGIGLWLAKNVIDAHDGNISVEPKDDLVITRIELPLETTAK